jgi:hypothetical protein
MVKKIRRILISLNILQGYSLAYNVTMGRERLEAVLKPIKVKSHHLGANAKG